LKIALRFKVLLLSLIGISLVVFQRFFRVDAAHSRNFGGTGLGLAIVKDLVEKMNGKVWVECPERAGSKFCMTFPREIGGV